MLLVFWSSLIVDAWLLVPDTINSSGTVELLHVGVETGGVAFLVVLMVWTVCSPQPVRHRIAFLICLSIASSIVWLLASAAPGDGLNFTLATLSRLFLRRVLAESLDLSTPELGLMVTTAILIFGALNRQLSQVRLHRQPLPARSKTSDYFRRLQIAYRLQNETPPGLRASEMRWGAVGLVLWVGLFLWVWTIPTWIGLDRLFGWSAVLGLLLFLMVWCASLFLWRWWAGLVLAFGTILLAIVPWSARIVQFALTGLPEFQTTNAVSILIFVASVVLASIFCMGLYHQTPRRLDGTTTTDSPSDQVSNSTNNSPVMQSPIASGNRYSWIWIGGIWGLCCSLAYWLPRNIDAVVLLEAEPKSIRLANLSARLIQLNNGKRNVVFSVESVLIDRFARGISNQDGVRPILWPNRSENSRQSHVVAVSQLDERIDQCLPILSHLSNDKIPIQIVIGNPVRDLDRLMALLETGVDVECSLDAGDRPLPVTRLSVLNLNVVSFKSIDTWDKETWDFIYGQKNTRHTILIDCQLPKELPVVPGSSYVFIRCKFPPELTRSLSRGDHFAKAVYFRIPELLPGHRFDTVDLLRFLGNNLVIDAMPPFDTITEGSSPAIIVPDRRWEFSSWKPSIRPLLLDYDLAKAATNSGIKFPGLLEFDDKGQIVAMELVPSRDCPAGRQWTVFPHVESLRLHLDHRIVFDSRTSPSEENIPEEIDFYPEAFPNLSAITLTKSTDWLTDELTTITRKVLSLPNIKQVELPIVDESLWEMTVELSHANTLIIDFSSRLTQQLFNYERENILDRINELDKLKNLKKVIIRDPNHLTRVLFGPSDMAQIAGSPNTNEDSPRVQLSKAWTERIQAVVPQIEVQWVDGIPDQVKENDELDD